MGTYSNDDQAASSRTFWTYWTASTASGLGDAVTTVALPLTALVVLHASTFEVSLLTAASYVAWLAIGLPAGVVVARLPLRETQVAMDVLRALALASVPLTWWSGHLSLAQLVVVALLVGLADVVFGVANMTLLPAIIPQAELSSRNSLISGTHAVTTLGGPSLGGVLVQLIGAVPTLLVDTASYVVSAVLLGRLPRRTTSAPAAPGRMRTMIAEGWRFVTRHPVMGPCMWDATGINFACGALMALAPVYLLRILDAAPGLVGLLIATEGVGALLGAAVAPRLIRRFGSARTFLGSGVVGAVLALLLPLGDGVTGMVLFALGNAGFAAGVVVGSITTRTFRQIASPPELLSRVMATVRFVSWGAIPVGALTAGGVASSLGVRAAMWATALATFVPVAICLASPIRGLRDLEDAVAVEEVVR